MGRIKFFLIFILFLSGCATYQTKKEPKKSFEEIVNMKLTQAISIAETSLEISKNAEKIAIESLNISNQAKANSEEAIKKINEAIEAINENREFTEKEVKKAIEAANKAVEEAIKVANEASQKAIDASNEAIKVANKAAEEAIRSANQSSERSIAVANQIIGEINRLRATIQTKPEEPIIEEEPKEGKYYVIKKGDTLKKIAYKFYNDTRKWELIYKVNKNIIKNPNILVPGTKILIP
ncbi:MAG: LysM peptidoglycan-binding domain-containing protein [Candidatus Omnitrophica bacterium]|nr:LysM peptidoglycan-binding domain-containing protein [Candidatus Omnitrophota bacterium]